MNTKMEDVKKFDDFLNEELGGGSPLDDVQAASRDHSNNDEYAVRIKGFKSKEEAQDFVDWYSKSGGYDEGGHIADIIYVN